MSTIKPVLTTKFQDYRKQFDAPDKNLDDKFDLAELFGTYLDGMRDTLNALGAEADDVALVEKAARVTKADIEKVESEYELSQALS